jgi:hypothetical protein
MGDEKGKDAVDPEAPVRPHPVRPQSTFPALCTSCLTAGGTVPMRLRERSTDSEITTRIEIAVLTSEIDAIHSANSLYWGQGESATHEARAEYCHRLDRLEEIRKELAQLRSA